MPQKWNADAFEIRLNHDRNAEMALVCWHTFRGYYWVLHPKSFRLQSFSRPKRTTTSTILLICNNHIILKRPYKMYTRYINHSSKNQLHFDHSNSMENDVFQAFIKLYFASGGNILIIRKDYWENGR